MLSKVTPMLATLVAEPFHRDGWVFEEKVDGWRILAYKDGGRVRLLSRHGVDHRALPEARRRGREAPAHAPSARR